MLKLVVVMALVATVRRSVVVVVVALVAVVFEFVVEFVECFELLFEVEIVMVLFHFANTGMGFGTLFDSVYHLFVDSLFFFKSKSFKICEKSSLGISILPFGFHGMLLIKYCCAKCCCGYEPCGC